MDIMTKNKTGYIATKLGQIPEDWTLCSFQDIADKKVKWSITGGPFGSDLKSEHYTDSGIQVIQLQNIGDGDFLDNYQIFTSKEKADQLLACNIFPGELILSKMGDPVARCCVIPNRQERYLMGSDGIRLVPDKERFDYLFVKNYINFRIFRNNAIRHSTGSTRQRIGLTDLKKLPFVCPPLPEQQKIAKILSTWDKAIEKLEQLISEKEQLKKGLMQQLLTGEKRFPGFTDEWEVKTLEELGQVLSGLTYSPDNIADNGVLVLRSSNVQEREIVFSDNVFVNTESLKFTPVKEDDILICVRNGSRRLIGKNALIPKKSKGMAFGAFMTVFRSDRNKYLIHLFDSDMFYRQVHRNLGATINSINGSDLKRFKFLIPKDKNEELKIASLLLSFDIERKSLRQELEKLKTQKKGLMQKLLTGEVLVKV